MSHLSVFETLPAECTRQRRLIISFLIRVLSEARRHSRRNVDFLESRGDGIFNSHRCRICRELRRSEMLNRRRLTADFAPTELQNTQLSRKSQRMRRQSLSFLWPRPIACALLFVALSLSFSACVNRSRKQSAQITQPKANYQQSGISPQAVASANQTNARLININSATAGELEKLPGIGKGLAARIIEHRERYGPFRRPEHLIAVRGISDRRFRALRDLIAVE